LLITDPGTAQSAARGGELGPAERGPPAGEPAAEVPGGGPACRWLTAGAG